jgi:hypothetical protein
MLYDSSRMNPANHHIHFREEVWSKKDIGDLWKAKTLPDLLEICTGIVLRFPGEGRTLHLVACHETTGWNSRVGMSPTTLEAAIVHLHEQEGKIVFSQMPLLPKLRQIALAYKAEHPHDQFCKPISEEFYLPLIRQRRFCTIHFVRGFRRLIGSENDYELCLRSRAGVRIFTSDQSERFIREHALAA